MLSAGVILGGGNYMALLTLDHLGVTLGYPLTQFGIVINTLWGVFYFREVQSKKSLIYLSIGIFFVVMGALLMSIVRPV
jgi:glucose uptake protein GlcU